MLYLPTVFTLAVLGLSATAKMERGSIARASSEDLEYANAHGWTNAQRLANNLPPIGPKFAREPTPVHHSARASPSPSSVMYTGHFGVRRSSGRFLGYLSGTSDGIGGLVRAGDPTELSIAVTEVAGSTNPLDVYVSNAPFSSPYVGGQGTEALGAGSSNAVAIGSVDQTAPYSVPDTDTGGESSIWVINPRNKVLKAQWVNPDSSLPPTYVVYNTDADRLFLTGDTAAYNASVGCAAVSVRVFLSG